MLLHWVTATAFAIQIGLGWRMGLSGGPQTFAVFQLHKSIGITILALTLLRIGWRLLNPPPPFPVTMARTERKLAHGVHFAFYALLLILPLSGWLIVSSSKVFVPTFLYGTIPLPHVPGVAELAPWMKQAVNAAAETTHLFAVWLAIAAILLHLAGVFKHQLVDRGGDLARMAPLPARWLTPVTFVLIGIFFLAGMLGWLIQLAPIKLSAPASGAMATNSTSLPSSVAAGLQVSAAEVTKPVESVPEAIVPAPSTAESPIWLVRVSASSIRFHTSWSQGDVDGGFRKWRANIKFDPNDLTTSAATVTVDTSSIFASDSGQQSALPEDDWFAVATHPTATWRSTKFRHLAGDRYVADGNLTLRGTSRPLLLPFSVKIVGNRATMSGSGKVDRTMFGIGQGEWTATTDLPALVTLSISIVAERAPPTG